MSKFTLLTIAAVAVTTVGARDSAPTGLPLPYFGGAGQVITVVSDNPGATTATLTAWQRGQAGWQAMIGPIRAFVGSKGIGLTADNVPRTPVGIWALTEAFGIAPDPGTALPYRHVDGSDWWVSDARSPEYNRHARCPVGTCPFDEDIGENLGAMGPVYDYAVVLDYNRNPVIPGLGSAFFLHVTDGTPTQGCVAIGAAELRDIMRWLDPAEKPVIEIGFARRLW
ncbi:L,D-transpeptidase family protein [Nocardia sp. NPDC005366]|uniref:L,D-transpeptidase family protein n=1 Tax=Nocardia sp. NPDC005366 TaxID=3156878 RepID=UPI0033BB85B9